MSSYEWTVDFDVNEAPNIHVRLLKCRYLILIITEHYLPIPFLKLLQIFEQCRSFQSTRVCQITKSERLVNVTLSRDRPERLTKLLISPVVYSGFLGLMSYILTGKMPFLVSLLLSNGKGATLRFYVFSD